MTLHIRPEWVVLLLMWAFVVFLGASVIIAVLQAYQAQMP